MHVLIWDGSKLIPPSPSSPSPPPPPPSPPPSLQHHTIHRRVLVPFTMTAHITPVYRPGGLLLHSPFVQTMHNKCIHTYTLTHVNTCNVHTHTHIYTHNRMHTCVHTFTHRHTHARTHAHTHFYLRGKTDSNEGAYQYWPHRNQLCVLMR